MLFALLDSFIRKFKVLMLKIMSKALCMLPSAFDVYDILGDLNVWRELDFEIVKITFFQTILND